MNNYESCCSFDDGDYMILPCTPKSNSANSLSGKRTNPSPSHSARSKSIPRKSEADAMGERNCWHKQCKSAHPSASGTIHRPSSMEDGENRSQKADPDLFAKNASGDFRLGADQRDRRARQKQTTLLGSAKSGASQRRVKTCLSYKELNMSINGSNIPPSDTDKDLMFRKDELFDVPHRALDPNSSGSSFQQKSLLEEAPSISTFSKRKGESIKDPCFYHNGSYPKIGACKAKNFVEAHRLVTGPKSMSEPARQNKPSVYKGNNSLRTRLSDSPSYSDCSSGYQRQFYNISTIGKGGPSEIGDDQLINNNVNFHRSALPSFKNPPGFPCSYLDSSVELPSSLPQSSHSPKSSELSVSFSSRSLDRPPMGMKQFKKYPDRGKKECGPCEHYCQCASLSSYRPLPESVRKQKNTVDHSRKRSLQTEGSQNIVDARRETSFADKVKMAYPSDRSSVSSISEEKRKSESRTGRQSTREGLRSELKSALEMFDIEGLGCVSTKRLRHILMTFGEALTKEEVDDIIRLVDVDGDGQIRSDEFAERLCLSLGC